MSRGITPPDDVRAFVERLAKKEGTEAASDRLQLSRETIARLMAGLPVQRATISHVKGLMK
jgi:hypothetical protein